jgi:spore coat protein A
MRFVVGATGPSFRIPDRLSTVAPLPAASVTRSFHFRAGGPGWVINGAAFGPAAATVTARYGTVEVWRLVTDFHHPVHLHLNPFQVLSRGLGAPLPTDAGWKDTIDLRPAEEAAIAVRFDAYRGRYLFHCHNLEHEDMGMMANLDIR